MTQKRKPYASITIYKPRFSRIVSTAILLLLIAALGSLGLREIEGWRSALEETELLVQERTALLEQRTQRLQAVEAQLEKAEGRLRSEPLTWRTLEPAGFAVEPNVNGWQGLMTATVCARGHQRYEAYVHFFSSNRSFIAKLMHSGNYELVGKQRPYGVGADRDQFIRYYTRKDVFDYNPSTWTTTGFSATDHVKAWRDRLASYCSATFE